jgi:MFS family permease
MTTFLQDQFKIESLAWAGLSSVLFLQVASVFGAPFSGWAADKLRQRTPRGRMMVQAAGVLCAAPFVVICGQSHIFALTAFSLVIWGFFKGVYDANIFAAMYDVIRPEARGTAAGFMNAVGWIGGGGGPLVVGYIKQKFQIGLGDALALGGVAYAMAGVFLIIGLVFFVKRDTEKMQASIAAQS